MPGSPRPRQRGRCAVPPPPWYRASARPGGAAVGLASGSRQLSRAVSEASGLSQEEAGLLVAGAAVTTALLAALRVIDFVTDVWPRAAHRPEAAWVPPVIEGADEHTDGRRARRFGAQPARPREHAGRHAGAGLDGDAARLRDGARPARGGAPDLPGRDRRGRGRLHPGPGAGRSGPVRHRRRRGGRSRRRGRGQRAGLHDPERRQAVRVRAGVRDPRAPRGA